MIIRELITKLGFQVDTASIKKFDAQIGETKKQLNGISGNLRTLSSDLRSAGLRMTGFITLPILGFLGKSVVEFDKEISAISQVEAALVSTGNAAGVTSDQIRKAASELQSTTRFADEEIMGGVSSQLLIFQNIGKNIFFQAQKTILDIAARTGGDLKGTTMQVGKALSDPIRGLMMLRRVGIVFSAEQELTIKQLTKEGRLLEAQGMILTELNKKFGGSAEALGNVGIGPLIRLKNVMGDLMEEFGKIVSDFLIPVVKWLRTVVLWFQNLSETTKKIIVIFMLLLAVLGPLLLMLGAISGSIIAMVSAWAILKVAIAGATAMMAGFNAMALLIPALIVAGIILLLLVFQDLYFWIMGKKSMFGEFFGGFEEAKSGFMKWLEGVKLGLEFLLTPLRMVIEGWQMLFGLVGSAGSQFGAAFKNAAVAAGPMNFSPPMGTNIGAFGGSPTMPAGRSVKNNFDIKANIQVPAGTSEEQKAAVAAMSKQVIEETISSIFAQSANGMAVVE